MNTPVSFPLAKLLKEKGFQQEERPSYLLVDFSQTNVFKTNPENIGIGDLIGYYVPNKTVNAPTISDVVMWLYEKYGVWISVDPENDTDTWFHTITHGKSTTVFGNYSTLTEAYEKGIEHILRTYIK